MSGRPALARVRTPPEAARRRLLGLGGRLLLVPAALPLLGGCAFQLRQPPRLGFASISLQGFDARSTLAAALRLQLQRQVQVLEDPARAAVVLQALSDTRERVVVASTSAAQVRELQLRLKLTFRAATPQGQELIPRSELSAVRDMSWREGAALAKEREEQELFREMLDDVVQQLLRRLAALAR